MRVLLDTNILTRLANPAQVELHDVAEASVDALRKMGHVPSLLPQNLYEFWVVATRPSDVNGLGMTIEEVRDELNSLLSLFHVLQDERAIFPRWLDLVTDYAAQGKAAHDARLVAGMLRHGLSHLLTFNDGDFARYDQITVVTPPTLAAGATAL